MNNTTPTFAFATAERIIFGCGTVRRLPQEAVGFGRSALVLTGSQPQRHTVVLEAIRRAGVAVTTHPICGEPTIENVQELTGVAGEAGADHVIAIGGGSVIDAAKAVAAMTTNPGDVLDYLEVVGAGRSLEQRPAPVIAVPTTAGAGAEVTRNAVLKVPDRSVKVSMRHAWMLPRVALVDPELAVTMPAAVTAATGLDTLTQLLEAFISKKATPLTDGFCREGLLRAARSLERAWADGHDIAARTDMSLAALLGGLALANAGLGAVHGFAGPLGGMIDVPHGVICARLLPEVLAANAAVLERDGRADVIERLDEVARIVTGRPNARYSELVEWIRALCDRLQTPPLRSFGLTADHIPQAVAKAKKTSSMRGNPVGLPDDVLHAILEAAL